MKIRIKSANQTVKTWGTLLFLAVIWGFSFFFIKKSLLAFSWDQVAVLRVGISMLAFFPFFLQNIKKVSKEKYKYILAMGLLGNLIPAFLFPLAQTHVSSSLTGILNSMTPLFVFLFGIFFFGVAFHTQKLFGVLMGLGGAAVLILYGNPLHEEGNMLYSFFAIGACICYAFSANIIKNHLQDLSSVTSGSIAFAMIGPFSWIYLLSTDFVSVVQTHPKALLSLGSVAMLSLLGTFLATIVFIRLIQATSALFGSAVAYFIPIVAIWVGFLDGEWITLWHFLGMGLILAGVYLTK